MTSWWRHHCIFSEFVYKTCQRQPTELKLDKLIVYSKLHKICKFENHVTRNNVIMTSLPKTMEKQWGNADLCETKQIIHHLKGIDESYPKMYFLLNLSYYVKGCGHFCQILAFFYNARSPNMVMSRGPRSKFRKFSCFPNSAFNIRKSYKISSGKALYFRSYQPKPHGGWKTVLLGLKPRQILPGPVHVPGGTS